MNVDLADYPNKVGKDFDLFRVRYEFLWLGVDGKKKTIFGVNDPNWRGREIWIAKLSILNKNQKTYPFDGCIKRLRFGAGDYIRSQGKRYAMSECGEFLAIVEFDSVSYLFHLFSIKNGTGKTYKVVGDVNSKTHLLSRLLDVYHSSIGWIFTINSFGRTLYYRLILQEIEATGTGQLQLFTERPTAVDKIYISSRFVESDDEIGQSPKLENHHLNADDKSFCQIFYQNWILIFSRCCQFVHVYNFQTDDWSVKSLDTSRMPSSDDYIILCHGKEGKFYAVRADRRNDRTCFVYYELNWDENLWENTDYKFTLPLSWYAESEGLGGLLKIRRNWCFCHYLVWLNPISLQDICVDRLLKNFSSEDELLKNVRLPNLLKRKYFSPNWYYEIKPQNEELGVIDF